MMIKDDRDPPVEPLSYLSGVKVVDIGDLRVARGKTRRPYSSCSHHQLVYDQAERRIWCSDCEHDVDAFDAFTMLVERYSAAYNNLEDREQRLDEAERFKVRLIATKIIEEAWRHRDSVPACPHCHNGLFPEDFKAGASMVGKDYAKKRLEKGNRRDP